MSNNNINYDKIEECTVNDCSNSKNIYKYNDDTFCCKKYKDYDNGILDFILMFGGLSLIYGFMNLFFN